MLGMTVENIGLVAQTNGGEFSVSIPLSEGQMLSEQKILRVSQHA